MSKVRLSANKASVMPERLRPAVNRRYAFVLCNPERCVFRPSLVEDRDAERFTPSTLRRLPEFFDAVLSTLGLRDTLLRAMRDYDASWIALEFVHRHVEDLATYPEASAGLARAILDLIKQMSQQRPQPLVEYDPKSAPFSARLAVISHSSTARWEGREFKFSRATDLGDLRVAAQEPTFEPTEWAHADYDPKHGGLFLSDRNTSQQSITRQYELGRGLHQIVRQLGNGDALARVLPKYAARYVRFEVGSDRLGSFWKLPGARDRVTGAILALLQDCEKPWSFPIAPASHLLFDDRDSPLAFIRLTVFFGSATWPSSTVSLENESWHPEKVRGDRQNRQKDAPSLHGASLPGPDSLSSMIALTERLVPKVTQQDLEQVREAIIHANDLEPAQREQFVEQVNRLLPCLGRELRINIGGKWRRVLALTLKNGSVQCSLGGGTYGVNNPLRFD